MIEPEKIKDLHYKVNSTLNSLEFQKQRIIKKEPLPTGVSSLHDVDFYMIILRRLFRIIEEYSKKDSSVANLKGRHQHLYSKIKVRDHFEHGVDFSKIPDFAPGIKIAKGFISNNDDPHILSGDQKWFLKQDHQEMLNLMNHFLRLFN